MKFELSNRTAVPCIGFGTYKSTGDTAVRVVKEAIAAGYRHIDTAAYYENETEVGEGIRQSGLPREELFLTTKVWTTEREYDRAIRSCEDSLHRLGTDYLDLLLIHWPATKHSYGDGWAELNRETWRALETLYRNGTVRAIGVSNFMPNHLEPLLQTADIAPMVDQVELHPGFPQTETAAFCRAHHILVEAWSPLARNAVLQNETLAVIAEKHGKSPAQVSLRWELQNGIVPLPKSTHMERMKENLSLFDFVLTDEEMHAIDALHDIGGKCVDVDRADT